MIVKDNVLRVMELFFWYPDRKFHLRELERRTGLSLPGVRRIAAKLERQGLIASRREAVVKNFFAARDARFVALKRSYNLWALHECGLVAFLADRYEQPEAVVLFGSYGKGEDVSESDVDIAVVTGLRKDLDFSRFERALKRPVRVLEVRLAKAEKEFLNTLANGIVLEGYLAVL